VTGPPRAVVFLDGDYEEAGFYVRLAREADQVVAADGGARFLIGQGLQPDLLVGDFDSLAPADVEQLAARGVPVVRHPVRKNQTDGELAVEEALRRGAGEVVLAGALGALDHTLGHLAVLRRLAARGVTARIAAPGLTVTVLTAPAAAEVDAPRGTRVSLVPLGGDATVTIAGMDYPLARGLLPADACLGLGNAVTGAGRIEVHEGVVAMLVGEDRARRPASSSEGPPEPAA
jgi:thiamine pyrophosphokinase